MFVRIFLLCFLAISSVSFLQAAKLSAEYKEAIRAIGRSAERSIRKGVKSGKIGGNIAVVHTVVHSVALPPNVGRLLVEEVEFATKKVGSAIFVYDYKQLDNVTRKAHAGKKDGILLEREGLVKAAKSMGASYFATIDIKFRYGKRITMTMSIYDNETKVAVWSDTWVARLVDIYFLGDVGGQVYADNFYFFGMTSLVGLDIADVAVVGLRVDLLGSVVDTSKQYGSGFRHKYILAIGVAPQVEVSFSLINSFLPRLTMFDLELFLRGGVLLSSMGFSAVKEGTLGYKASEEDKKLCADAEAEYPRGSVCDEMFRAHRNGRNGYSTIHWRPILVSGFNLLFLEKFYLFVGGDFGPLMGSVSHKGTYRVKHKPLVTPVVGFGFRMPIE